MGREKIVGEWKKFNYYSYVLVGEAEKWREEKLSYFVEKKNKRIKNIILQIYFHVLIG